MGPDLDLDAGVDAPSDPELDTDDGSDAASLYETLEHTVLPLYHRDRAGWIAAMQGAIAKNASFLNSHRMMRRYAVDAYLR